MTHLAVILRSLFHHWRVNASVALGVAAATTVLTGALLVGDSMRGSLRELSLDRLGFIDQILLTDRFFREDLAAEVASADGFDEHFTAAIPVILLQTNVKHADTELRATQVITLGIDETFWQLDPSIVPPLAAEEDAYDQIVINQKLADELGVSEPGEWVLLRVPRPSQIPADSPLGRKTDQTSSRRLKITHILPNQGLARFSLNSNQQTPLVAFVPKRILQSGSVLNQKGKVNGVIIAGKHRDRAAGLKCGELLSAALHPQLKDYGLTVETVTFKASPGEAKGYVNIASDQMVLPPQIASRIVTEFKDDDAQPAITYLANWIRTADGTAKVPYSTVTAIDSNAELGPLFRDNGRPLILADDQIAINSWTAGDMAEQGREVITGDRIELVFFEPESTHGQAAEQTATFLLADIAETAQPQQTPTPVTDASFTPEVPGLTDKDSIDNWDPPFPYDADRVRSVPPDNQDDLYWKSYKATPKAFISYAAGERLWKSRFGAVTTIRIPISPSSSAEEVASRLQKALIPAEQGFVFRPVKREALDASRGTTPFAWLFIGFSFFIIAAAIMLVGLLFQLGIEQRSSQVGVMLAVGLDRKLAGRFLSREGLFVALVGGLLGIGLGIGYAWLMIAGLNSPDWWGEAIATPFLALHLENPLTYGIGLFSGVFIAWLTIVWCVRGMRKQPIRNLMSGQTRESETLGGAARRAFPVAESVAMFLLITSIALFVLATTLSGEAQAGAFFGGGAAVLSALLLFIWARLRRGGSSSAIATGGWPLLRLALRNARRNPGRSTLTIGLVASATFLIIAISAFRIDPDERGAGGFDVLAESTQPILFDLNSAAGRDELRITGDAAATLEQCDVVALRVKGGDDASCLNLYQSQQPRILGVSQNMVDYLGRDDQPNFAWAQTAANTNEERANPWLLLDKQYDDTPDAIPVVIDKNTAMYSMHLYSGVGSTFTTTDDDGREIRFRIVGLLANSILQGSLLIGEEQFTSLYPAISGYQMFLVRQRPVHRALDATSEVMKTHITNELRDETMGRSEAKHAVAEQRDQWKLELISALEASLSEYGVDAVIATARLRDLLAVQNTYLSTFQSLGALGLLLGTFGLATVQLRSVLERRGELALMRSAGFRRARLAQMVMLENVLLLLGGLLTGLIAAVLAVVPHFFAGGAAIPWRDLAIYLGIVLLVGVASGFASVVATLRAPLLGALRGN